MKPRKRKTALRHSRRAVNAEVGVIDPVPRLASSADELWFLEQVSLGRWLDFSIPADVQTSIERLADYISRRAAPRFFGGSPTPAQLQLLRHAMEASYQRGYYLAILRYEDELKHVPELETWHRQRHEGGIRGRITQASRKQDRQAKVQAMLDQGMDVPEITKALGCSVATVYRLMQPAKPTPAKPAKKARRR
jgi:hypothetical protein